MKKIVFFFNLTAIAMFFVLFFSMGTNAGCTKDIDCKGNRICEKGICVDPGQTKSHPEGIITPEQKKSDDWLKKLNGVRYVLPLGGNAEGYDTLDIRGNKIIKGYIITRCLDQNCRSFGKTGIWQYQTETILEDREFKDLILGLCGDVETQAVGKGRIREDGDTIIYEICNRKSIYRREK